MAHSPLAPVLSPAQLAEALTTLPGARLLDVRTSGEYETVHIPGAYNVPVETLAEHAREIRTVAAPVILICQSGQRARRAEGALRSAGMANVHVLDGGMNAWIAAGHSTRRGPKRLSLERQVRIVAGALAATGGFLALLVNPLFAILPALVGSGLVFAGVTDTCGMAFVLAKLPYNRAATCDVSAMVRAFTTAAPPVGMGRAPASAAPDGSRCAA